MAVRGFPVGSAIGIGAVVGMTLGLLADSMLQVQGGLGLMFGMALGGIAGGLVDTFRMRTAK